MPRIARQVGFLTGRAARYLTSARNRFAEFARDSELVQVHFIPASGTSFISLPRTMQTTLCRRSCIRRCVRR